MNYFDPYPLCVVETTATAWRSQLAESENTPWLARTLAGRARELFPRFAAAYTTLRTLPRGPRRSIQRRLARSRDGLAWSPEWLLRGEGRRLRYKLARSLAGAALLLALAHNAQASTITVTTNKPGIKDGDGKCSLIEAIINTNNDAATHPDCPAGSSADTIVLPAGSTHMLTGIFTSYHGYTGLPVITSQITIQGNGSKVTRRKSRKLNRLIAVAATGNLSLENLTLSNGVEFYGGAIYNRGKVAITNCTISGGISYFGAGLFNGVDGNAVIHSSTFSKNVALYGGGIKNHQGTVAISNSTITSNKSVYGGDGIHSEEGSLTIANSIISKNETRSNGAGVTNLGGSFVIEHSVVTGNKGKVFGGGLLSWGGTLDIDNCNIANNVAGAGAGVATINFVPLTITNSTISGNSSRYQGGGIATATGDLSVDNTTISGNQAGDLGGGIAHFSGSSNVTNSTISGNSSRTRGGGVWNQGTMTVTNITIALNSAKEGGGVFNTIGHLSLARSIVTENIARVGTEIYNYGANIAANARNLLGASGTSGVNGFAPGATDIVPSVPVTSILAPLANNGGPTMTHALVPGSPAIDAIPGADPECTGTDQRGTPRPQGAGATSVRSRISALLTSLTIYIDKKANIRARCACDIAPGDRTQTHSVSESPLV